MTSDPTSEVIIRGQILKNATFFIQKVALLKRLSQAVEAVEVTEAAAVGAIEAIEAV